MSKGSKRRPSQTGYPKFKAEWDRIFRHKEISDDERRQTTKENGEHLKGLKIDK